LRKINQLTVVPTLLALAITFFVMLPMATYAQADTNTEFDCGAEYDPSVALRIGAQYREALRASDYERLRELRAERERNDLWQKNYTRNCSDQPDDTASVDDDNEVGGDDEVSDMGPATTEPQMCSTDGQACSDGLFCTSASGTAPGPDACEGSICSGKPIGISEGVSLSMEYDISALREALSGRGGSAGICSISGVTWSGGIKQNFVEGCCESKQSMVTGSSFDGSVKVSLAGAQCDIPAFHWGVAQVGVTAGISLEGQVTGSGVKLQCDESCGWKVGGQVGVDLNGGIYVAVGSPNVLKVSGTLSGAGTVSIAKSCGPVEVNGCAGPPSVNGSVLLGGWYKKSISYTFSDLVKCWN